jgi:hypothetical protein
MRVPEATFQQVMGVDRAAAGGGVHLASGHKEPFKVRKRDGDEGGKTPLKAVPSAGRLVAHVVMRELGYG